MKPSECIIEKFANMATDGTEAHRIRNFITAILQYLDEQWERAKEVKNES